MAVSFYAVSDSSIIVDMREDQAVFILCVLLPRLDIPPASGGDIIILVDPAYKSSFFSTIFLIFLTSRIDAS